MGLLCDIYEIDADNKGRKVADTGKDFMEGFKKFPAAGTTKFTLFFANILLFHRH